MVNPYEPTAHPAVQAKSDWRLAAVTFVTLGCLAIASTDQFASYLPATQAWILPRFGFAAVFAFPMTFLLPWYWWRQSSSLVVAGLFLIWLAADNGWALFQLGTRSTVIDATHDRLHSAWFWTVLLPILFALLLAVAERFSPRAHSA